MPTKRTPAPKLTAFNGWWLLDRSMETDERLARLKSLVPFLVVWGAIGLARLGAALWIALGKTDVPRWVPGVPIGAYGLTRAIKAVLK